MYKMLKLVSGAHLMMKQKTDGEFLVILNNIPVGVIQYHDILCSKTSASDAILIRISGIIRGEL
jgi:hypothetical protein